MAGRRYTAKERVEIVAAFRRSGMTRREFAQSRGVNIGTLSGWLYKIRSDDVRFVRVEARGVDQQPVEPEQTTIRLEIGGRLSVSLHELPSAAYLVDLAQALQQSC